MTLPPESLAALETLRSMPWHDAFYLAGSAALVHHLGHRRARDLDLMSPSRRLASPERRDLLTDLLGVWPGARVETARDGYLVTEIGSLDLTIRFYAYPYPLLERPTSLRGVAVAPLLDLVLMKLGAVVSRGCRRDFVDLYFATRRLPLAEALRRAPEKFLHVRDFPLQARKALADLSVAEHEPMPALSAVVEWPEVVTSLRADLPPLLPPPSA